MPVDPRRVLLATGLLAIATLIGCAHPHHDAPATAEDDGSAAVAPSDTSVARAPIEPTQPRQPTPPADTALDPAQAERDTAAAAVLLQYRGVERLQKEAEILLPHARWQFTRDFLNATHNLPSIQSRTLYRHNETRAFISQGSYDILPENERDAYTAMPVDEHRYYTTLYGTPLAYSRTLEILGQYQQRDLTGARMLDFGFGTVGHLRLLASLGMDVVGVDVDSFLTALYDRMDDRGVVHNEGRQDGRVTMVQGQWPADAATVAAVGSGFDLITSKNTLKRGYIRPEREVDPRMLVHLGVDDATFLKSLHDALKPGGRVLIFNICPAPAPDDKPYIPWADGRSPWTPQEWESAGFRVLAFDIDDSEPTRLMAHRLGWDAGPNANDLKDDLFAHYSLFERAD